MKKGLVLSIAFGFLVAGCGQEVEHKSTEGKSINETEVVAIAKTNILKLKEPDEIETFTEAVNNSKQEPGIVNMSDPQYKFNLGEKSYYLWINKESGTIMNTNDTHTIYTLPSGSVEKVYEYVSQMPKGDK